MKCDPRTPVERVLARSVAGPNACVLWTGAKTPQGYGHLAVNRRGTAVHRISYMAFHGPIPPGLEIDHICRVRLCVNPHHLQAVTHAENLRRSIRKLSMACRRGHALTPDNVFRHKNGDRECRICKRARNNAWKRRQTARRKAVSDGD